MYITYTKSMEGIWVVYSHTCLQKRTLSKGMHKKLGTADASGKGCGCLGIREQLFEDFTLSMLRL